MGGSSSTLGSVQCEDTDTVVLIKGIRLTDKVIDRMKEPPPVHNPQSGSSSCQSLRPQSETLASTEHLAPIQPHPPSYASTLVPPPPQQPTSPLVPFVPVSQETPTPSTSSPTIDEALSVTNTAADSVSASLPSVQEQTASEPLPIIPSPLTSTEPVLMPLPVEPVHVVLSPSDKAVDMSPAPPLTGDAVVSPTPNKLITILTESTTMLLTDDLLTAPLETMPSPTTVESIDQSVESAASSTPILNLDTAIPVIQVELPTSPTSEPVTEIETLSPDTLLPSPIDPMQILTEMPPAPVKPSNLPRDLEELVPPLPSSTLPVPCEVPLVAQIGSHPNEHTPAPTPVAEPAVAPVLPSLSETVGPLTSPQAVVTEEDLRKWIREELQKEMAALRIKQQLEEKAKAEAEAQAKAQQKIQSEVQKVMEKEQLVLQQALKDNIMQEYKNVRDEQLASQCYRMERKIQKLEQKERDLAKQDSMLKEQIAKQEKKTAVLSRVTAESFRKGWEETQKRFKVYQIKPVCSELQSEILKCYLKNTGQTLSCSSIASQYMNCVNNAKQNKKVSTRG